MMLLVSPSVTVALGSDVRPCTGLRRVKLTAYPSCVGPPAPLTRLSSSLEAVVCRPLRRSFCHIGAEYLAHCSMLRQVSARAQTGSGFQQLAHAALVIAAGLGNEIRAETEIGRAHV